MVTFQIPVSPIYANTYTNWTVALLVNLYGYNFLIFENQYYNATFADVIANLTGHYYTILPNGTPVEENYVLQVFPKGAAVTLPNGTNVTLSSGTSATLMNTTTVTLLNSAVFITFPNGTIVVTPLVNGTTVVVTLPNGTYVKYNGIVYRLKGAVNAILQNSTVVKSYSIYMSPIGYYGPWGLFTYVNGSEQFANFSSAAIHQFYLGVTTYGQSYNLTLTKTLYISGTLVATETYEPVGSWANGTYFGPITYLGTYVTSLGGAGQNVSSFLSPSSVQYQFAVALSIYVPNIGSYITQTLVTSTNNIYTTQLPYNAAPNSTEFYVIETANFTRGYYTTPTPANATCQRLVIWALPLSTLTVTGLFDLKGNPILSPEYFTFKVQENLGGYPLTISQVQGGWKTDITDVRTNFLHTLCGGAISSFSDLYNCFNSLNRNKFINATFSIYERPVLSWISGTISLTDSTATLSSVNLSPRLIVEYSYQATPFSGYQQPTSGYIDAIVLQAPLNATSPVNFAANLTVSILPVQIPLWWWDNQTLPNGMSFNNLALAQGLSFIFSGLNAPAYLNETGQYAVVAGLWGSSAIGANQLNTLYFWALPPYEYVPVTPGVYADLLTLVNASGYLPLPTLNAYLTSTTTGYGFRYLNWTQAVGLSSLFSQYGLAVSTNQYTYNFRVYAGKLLVGTANIIASYPAVYANGTMVETQQNVEQALSAQYSPSGAAEDAYTVQAIYYYYNATNPTASVYGLQAQKLSFYNLEHAINIAIHLVTTNILFRDFCGNVPSVVNGTISLTVSYNGVNFTLPQLPVSAEVPVNIPVAIDQWGYVLSKTATAYVTLNYFGYKLYGAPSNTAIPTSPVPITFSISQAPYFKPIVYLPIAPATFEVMAAVWTEQDSANSAQEIYLGPQYPLAGFVVVPYSNITGARMGESISNASGLAYFDELPLGVNFGVVVRTIDPATDMQWPFTAMQSMYNNSYSAYVSWLGLPAGSYAYTLGTRGPIDAGLVANNTVIMLTSCSATPMLMEAQVYNPVFRIYDKTGNYLLSSQYVTPGPYPGAAPPILVNVTFVLADEFSPYTYASRWENLTLRDYAVLTDFRMVGMTGMKSIFENLAQKYLSAAQAAAGCTAPPTGNASVVTNDFALAAMAGWLANASTNLYSAVFTLTSQQPKTGVPSICNLTASDVGVYDIAHLFLPGMRLHVKVWYMGYLVYDGYVTLTKPTVDIYTDVVPVNVTALTKDLRLPVNSYIGFTIANGYFGLALNSTYGPNFADVNILKSLVYPFGFSPIGLKNLLVSATAYNNTNLYNDRVWYNVTNSSSYFGEYVPVSSGADVVYLPDLVVLRNATTPLYMATVSSYTGTMTTTMQVPTPITKTYQANVFSNVTITGAGLTYVSGYTYPFNYIDIVVKPVSSTSYAEVNYTYDGQPLVTIAANSSIEIKLSLTGNGYIVFRNTTTPGATQPTFLVYLTHCATCPIYANLTIIATNMTTEQQTTTVTVSNGTEYKASFDRWVELQYPPALLRSYDSFERNTFFDLLTLGDIPNATLPGAAPIAVPSFTSPASGVYTTTFLMYLYNSSYVNLLNYRTLLLYLPWGFGTNATVYVTLTNVSNGATVTATYSLAKYSSLPQNLLPYEINLRNIALQLAPGDAQVEVSVNVTVVYTSGPTTSYYSVPVAYLLKGVGVNATYATVPLGTANGQSVTMEFVNLTAAGSAWSMWGGFGMPVTYVVGSGQVALLPAWASNTAAAGSYISRIWVIAAGTPEALCTTAPQMLGPLTDAKGAYIVGYNFYGTQYLVVNYIPNSTPVTKPYVPIWTQTNLDEFYDGSGQIAGLGFPIGGTSSFAIANYLGVPVWNVTALYQAGMTSFSLPTTALDWLTVYNNASFPILASGVTISCGGSSYTISISGGYVYVPMYSQNSVELSDYGFGRSYSINASALWSLDTYVPSYTYSVTAYYGGIVNVTQYFLQDIQEQAARAQSPVVASQLQAALSRAQSLLTNYTKLIQLFNLQPLSSVAVSENVLYASHAAQPISGWSYTFNEVFENGTKSAVTETTAGTWGALTTNSSDYDFKYYFSFPELPLKYVLDWNARPLANQTVVLFDRHHNVYAIIYTTNTGQLAYDLPDISASGHSDVVYVSWFDGYPLSVLTGNPAYIIWVYQQDIPNDVYQLGNASTTAQIRTYVYPAR
jgi:hypothetical protein